MKKIFCELCEGTEFKKENGMFVCQGCGTSYSVEEARGMMREVEGDATVSAGAPAVSVPMGNPNQAQIDNMLLLATNAHESGNNQEAENYCNQVIAIDAMSYKAWLLKGKAAGWQSTVQNQRITEAAHAFAQAIDFAPEEEKEDIKNEAVEELKNLGLACISLRKDRFSKYPDDEELAGFETDRKNLLSALMVLLSKGIATGIPDGYLEEIALFMNQAGVAAFEKIRSDYNNDNRPMPNDFEKAMKASDRCISLIESAIDASDDDDDEDITRYENLIVIQNFIIGMDAYPDYTSSWRTWELTSSAKTIRRNMITKYENKINEIKQSIADKEAEEARKLEKEKQARIDAYWAEHSEEKAAFDKEKEELEAKVDNISTKVKELDEMIESEKPSGSVPSEIEVSKLRAQLKELEEQRSKLGMFAGKEKKRISEEISAIYGRLESLNSRAEDEKKERNNEYEKKVAPFRAEKEEKNKELESIKKRIDAINVELTKDPEE